ncbi:unnamed protein product [Symbiodinium natans]|uniref:Uncharacterized protein n=1 Tax=Symbiodinium natans TaxID=878477 RepID=A0A812NV84_9DINO|nr:unnamed protein product [Symbiodinium natans]
MCMQVKLREALAIVEACRLCDQFGPATKAARESGEKHQEQLASELQGSKLELAELSVCLPCFCMEPLRKIVRQASLQDAESARQSGPEHSCKGTEHFTKPEASCIFPISDDLQAARESGEKHQEQLATELQGSKQELAELSACLACFRMEPLDRLCARLPFKTPSLPGNQVRSTQCGPWQEMEAAAHLSELDRLDAQDVQAELERLREELVSAKAAREPGEKHQEQLATELQGSKRELAELSASLQDAESARQSGPEHSAHLSELDRLDAQDVQAELERLREELVSAKAARESGEKHQEQLATELQGSKRELAELSASLQDAESARQSVSERAAHESHVAHEASVQAARDLASSKSELAELTVLERYEDVEYALQIASEAAAEDLLRYTGKRPTQD